MWTYPIVFFKRWCHKRPQPQCPHQDQHLVSYPQTKAALGEPWGPLKTQQHSETVRRKHSACIIHSPKAALLSATGFCMLFSMCFKCLSYSWVSPGSHSWQCCLLNIIQRALSLSVCVCMCVYMHTSQKTT